MHLLARAVAAFLAVAAIVAPTAAAHAHAALVSSEPEDGAVVAAAPRQFTLTFNEPVAALVLRLVTGGTATTLANPSGRQATMIVAAPPDMANGTHVLSWRVVSLDGHPVGGSVVFSIGAPSAGPLPDAEHAATPAVAALLWAAKVAVYIGLFIGIGGAFFRAWISPSGTKRVRAAVTAALVAGVVAVPLSVGAQGIDALGLALSGLGEKVAWTAGLETSYGLTAVAAAFSLLAGFFSLEAGSSRVARGLSLFGLLGAGVALALSGHASAAAPQWLMRPAVFVHAACLVFWIGSLIPLAGLLRGDRADALPALSRFSRTIPFAIVPLILSGGTLALVQIETPRALIAMAYGQLLVAKLCLVAILLAIAAFNRFRITPAVAAVPDAARRLVRSIVAEVALVVVIFGVVAGWRFTPPPRALEIAASRPATLHIHTDKAMADLTLRPGRAGPVQASIMLLDGSFGGLDAKEVTLTFRNEPAGIEPVVRTALRTADGHWIVDNLVIPVPGRWTVGIDILVNDFEKLPLEGTIDVRP
jgi:copper transport protein